MIEIILGAMVAFGLCCVGVGYLTGDGIDNPILFIGGGTFLGTAGLLFILVIFGVLPA